jgi:RNA polymerase sigma factor FliA
MTELTPGHDDVKPRSVTAAPADDDSEQSRDADDRQLPDDDGEQTPDGDGQRRPDDDGRQAPDDGQRPPIDPAAVEAGIAALWEAFAVDRGSASRDRLVLHYAPLVKYVAGRIGTGLPAHVDVGDLVQSGIFGLVEAIERFEPDRGLKFETYAMQRIRGAILDDLRAQDWVPRSVRSRAREVERAMERLEAKLHRTASDAEVAAELNITVDELRELFAQLQLTSIAALDELVVAGRGAGSLAETLPDHHAEDPVAAMEDRENRRLLAEAIAQLGERDRTVVTLYYFESLTLAEIGKVLGVTESRVCQLHTRAVLRLRSKLNEASAG